MAPKRCSLPFDTYKPCSFLVAHPVLVCMTCQHFTYGVDQHCHTMVGCNLRQKQLQQGEHLKKRCKLWAPTWQKQVGWAPEAG